MKRGFRNLGLGVLMLGLTAGTVPAQDAYWGHSDRGGYEHREDRYTESRGERSDRYYRGDRGRDERYRDRDYDRCYYHPTYYGPSYYGNAYYGDYDRHAGRTAAMTVGGAAAGALIGAAAGHGQGAAIGAVVGGVAGLIAGESIHHR